MRTGFSVGGISWIALELRMSGVSDDEQLLELMEDRGYTDALYASQMGGELLRVFVSCQEIVDSVEFVRTPFMRQGASRIVDTPTAERVKRVAEIDRVLDRILAELPLGDNGDGKPLNFVHLNCYLTGVAKFRSECAIERPRILLTFVELPPHWLLECPPAHICSLHGFPISFDQVWHKYILVYQAVSRRAVAEVIRKSKEFALNDLLGAVEVMNEPDYEWIPDEYRIEKSLNPAANPLTKYVTELHLPQIPDRDFSAATELKPWGGYGVQEGEWGVDSRPAVPLLEFPWGAKFDWYVSTAALFHEHVSWAVRDEVNSHGQKVPIVSSAVTHNDLLYFAQMYKSNKAVFRYVDAIAVHPYHFPGHNIWDSQFRKKERWPDWKSLTPRAYAELCFKRFDFIEEIAQCIHMKDQDLSFGLAGKKLWVTEFGIPTKVPGVFNDRHKAWQPFIRERGDPPLEGVKSAVWEDLWDAFLEQVTPQYLQKLGVDAFFFYALRETCVPGFDRHDDDRSNFGLLTQDGHPRTDPATTERLRAFGGSNSTAKSTDSVQRIALLLGRPEVSDDSNSIHATVSMLSASEKRLLYMLARDWYSGAGAIVDAGCFLGGSTVAFARGLQHRTPLPQTARPQRRAIHSFDRFILDAFMIRHYCEPDRYQEGDSFLPMYERNINEVRDLVELHAGDVTEFHWTGGPIELLFIDIAKQWSINDHLLADFFPHLIPGVSLVIQQDYVHEWCPWLHVTMEALMDYFTPLGFVEHNTMVYRYEKQIPAAILKFPVSAYTSEDKIDLMHRSVKRFFGSQRAIVECAEAVLLAELGSAEKAYKNIEILKKRFPSDASAKSAIQAAEGFVLSRLGAE